MGAGSEGKGGKVRPPVQKARGVGEADAGAGAQARGSWEGKDAASGAEDAEASRTDAHARRALRSPAVTERQAQEAVTASPFLAVYRIFSHFLAFSL